MSPPLPAPDPSFDPAKAWVAARKRIRNYTADQALQSMVDAGILTEKGNVKAPYRGVIVKKTTRRRPAS